MKVFKLLGVARSSLLKNKTRSLLTMLGIVIGVSAVVVMVAVGKGAQKNIEARIASLGTNMLMIHSGSSDFRGVRGGAGSQRTLTYKDELAIKEGAEHVMAVSSSVRVNGQVILGRQNWYTNVEGVSPDFLTIRSWDLDEGQVFTERDLRGRTKTAVLGATVVEKLFAGASPIGQTIRIRSVPFKVVGTLKAKGQNNFGRDQDDIILIPVTTALFRLASDQRYVSSILASAYELETIDQAQAEITEILRQTHKLVDGQENDFNIRNQTEITEAFSSTTQALTMLLGAIAGVSLFVGGVGIMNIMLVSVTERTREIGIRVAVGARSLDIMVQFLIESIVLSLAGGLMGVLLSWGICGLLTRTWGMTTIIETPVVVVALVVSAGIGIFFGLYPARKASRLDPIDALRHE